MGGRESLFPDARRIDLTLMVENEAAAKDVMATLIDLAMAAESVYDFDGQIEAVNE